MVKKILFSIRYILLALLVTSFLGACTPKKNSPVNDTLAQHGDTVAGLNGEDEDDGAWESDSDDSISRTDRLAQNYSRTHSTTGSTGDLLQKARTALGTPYVRGGTSRNGFDCSGFVQWSYNSVGIQLPRTAREQSQVGTPIRRMDDIQAGDIVAFRHPRRGYHTGIYVGDGKFIHSPRKRNVVRINSLDDPYFSQTFMGARRLTVNNEGDIEAAEQMLVAYAKQPPSPKASSSRGSSKKKQDKSSRRSVTSKKSAPKTVAVNTTKSSKVSAKNEKASTAKDSGKNSSAKNSDTTSGNTKKSNASSKSSAKKSDTSSKSSASKAGTTSKSSAAKSDKTAASKSAKASAGDSKKSSSKSAESKKSSSSSKKSTSDTKKSAR